MTINPSNINTFLMFKLPAAYLCGVRMKSLSETTCVTSVRFRWINQNPFGSMYFAVQAMAAELSTGALIMAEIKRNDQNISMLVRSFEASFSKRAVGRIAFQCNEGGAVKQCIREAVASGDSQICEITSVGTDESGEVVAVMKFTWSVKARQLVNR